MQHHLLSDKGIELKEVRMTLVPAVEQKPTLVAWILFDATADKKFIKMDPVDGSLAIFDSEESAMAAKKQNYGTDYERCEYYSTPQPAPEPALLLTALRQYNHNNGEGFVFGYDKAETDRIVAGLIEDRNQQYAMKCKAREQRDKLTAPEGEPVGFCEDTALSLAERTFSTEVDEQLAEDVIQYARRLHNRYTAPQPVPEVVVLVEALQAISRNELDAQRAQHIATIALAAYHKRAGKS